MRTISLGIMAYNEQANIDRLLQSILNQSLPHDSLKEIFVVASGCTDRTEDIVLNSIQKDNRIKLLRQSQREGKASAINLFLSNASGDIFILESGDTVPAEGILNKLVSPFKDPTIGMTGARPVPVNPKTTFIGFCVHLMWSLHHKIALTSPKLGELIAIKNFITQIPRDTAVDEASIEAIVKKNGYKLCYVPDAIVSNKGPENVKDFIKQRRRIATGHKHLLHKENYQVSTAHPLKILVILFKEHSWNFKHTLWTFGAIALEMISRTLGNYDFYIKKKNPYIWDIAASTKKLP